MQLEGFHILAQGKPSIFRFSVISIGVVGLVIVMLWSSFLESIEDRNNLGGIYTRMTEGTITRTIESISNSLFPLIEDLKRRPPQWFNNATLSKQTEEILRFSPHIRQIALLRNGETLHNSNSRSASTIDIERLNIPPVNNHTLIFGKPFAGRFLPTIDDKNSNKKSRRRLIPIYLSFVSEITGDQHIFIVALNEDYLSRLFKDLKLEDKDAYALVRFDGTALSGSEHKLFEDEINVALQKTISSGADESKRTFSAGILPKAQTNLRLSSKFPFAVIITTDHFATYKNWLENNGLLIIALFATTVVVLVSAYFLFRDFHRTRRLKREVHILSAAVHQSPLSVLITDRKGRIKYANQAFTQTYGYEPQDYLGQTPSILKSGHTDNDVYDHLWETLMAGKPWQGEFQNKTKSGGLVPTFSAISPVFDQDYYNSHIIGILTDISEQKLLEEQREHATRKAEAASAAKSTFLATMSHELRTPMTGIKGIIDLLLSDPDISKESHALLDDLATSSNALMMLLNDILDLSKIEAGKLQAEKQPCNPGAIVQNVHHLFKEQADKKNITLSCTTTGPDDLWVISDSLRLRQILSNLVSNAIKFTDKGKVEITYKISPTSNENANIFIEVHDSGIGMTPTQLKSIFNPFTQADASTTRRFGGTGLGLSITKQLCDLLGGTLEVQSSFGKGSVFKVKLTVDLAQTAETKQQPDVSLPHLNILLAEDNQINIKVVSTMLEQKGHHVDKAENGLIAVQKSGEKPYDLILMDMQMPEMDGLEATQAIRQTCPHNKDGLIFAFTADAFNDQHDNYISHGIDDVVTKPPKWDVLEQKIAYHLHKKNGA